MGNFNFKRTGILGLMIIEPEIRRDGRGFFMETYHRRDFAAAGIEADFVQDNHSLSSKGVLRGLHFQREHPQEKLVRVLFGAVFDVAMDLRPGSLTFGKWHGEILSAENRRQLYVPECFAHGFLVLTETAEFAYKCADFYTPGDEAGIRWDDRDLAIEWPLEPTKSPVMSERDRGWPSLREWLAQEEIKV